MIGILNYGYNKTFVLSLNLPRKNYQNKSKNDVKKKTLMAIEYVKMVGFNIRGLRDFALFY